MANPRIFLSSTYYDLKHIREDLKKFITELGYEPVMHEKGDIPYGKDKKLEEYCYEEIKTCDILINIVGGNFGSTSKKDPYSVSQMELKKAHELNKQIYIFVKKNVHVEYRSYLNNRNKDFNPNYVDDVRIYEFLEEVYNYPTNNTIQEFDSVKDITQYLREQWAGLFQRFLQEKSQREYYNISKKLENTAEVLSELITYTTKERDETIKKLLVHAHPIFNEISSKTDIPIKIYFTNNEELDDLLTAFDYISEPFSEEDELVYVNDDITLTITKEIFDENGDLKPVEHGKWNEDFVEVEYKEDDDEFDVPF